MPPPWLTNLVHDALLWRCNGRDRHGQPLREATYVPLDVRWVPKAKQIVNAKGDPVLVDVQVRIDDEQAGAVPLGSILWRGSVADLVALNTGTDIPGMTPAAQPVYEVVGDNSSDDLGAVTTARVLYLRRYNDSFPQIGPS